MRGTLLGVLLGATWPSSALARVPAGSWVVVEAAQGPHLPADAESAGNTLFFKTLSPEARALFVADVNHLALRLEARAHPLAHDFSDTPIEQDLSGLLRRALPALSAARTLASPGRLRDGRSVSLSRSCPKKAVCFRLGEPIPADVAFAAWPATSAIILSAPGRVAAVAERIRRPLAPDDPVALVLTRADLAASPVDPEISRALRRLDRRLKHVDARWRTVLSALRQHTPVPALPIASDQVWIIPRMSTLARPEAFRAEIRRRLGDAAVVWRLPATGTPKVTDE